MKIMFLKSEFNLKKSFIVPSVRNGEVKVGIPRSCCKAKSNVLKK